MTEINSETAQQTSNGHGIVADYEAVKFPPDLRFTQDLRASEYRILLLGWLSHAHTVLTSNGGAQEFRETIARISALTDALTMHQIKINKAALEAQRVAQERDAS